MTLSAQILALDDGERTTREIAELVYGWPATVPQVAYVRIVIRQRRGKTGTAMEKYVAKNRAAINAAQRIRDRAKRLACSRNCGQRKAKAARAEASC